MVIILPRMGEQNATHFKVLVLLGVKWDHRARVKFGVKSSHDNLVQHPMLMHDQHLYKNSVMVTEDYYYPDWGCFVHFFATRGWKIDGMAGDLKPQPSQVPITAQSQQPLLTFLSPHFQYYVNGHCRLLSESALVIFPIWG